RHYAARRAGRPQRHHRDRGADQSTVSPAAQHPRPDHRPVAQEGTAPMRVLILAAITVDGKIARADAEFTGWSSHEDKRLFARTSREAGVVVMGRRTFETLPAPLPGRIN